MIQGLGKRLQEQRMNLKISQKEAASAVGCSASIISNYESGERTPSVEALISLAGLYHCSTDYLLGIDKTPVTALDVSMLDSKQLRLLQDFLYGLSE